MKTIGFIIFITAGFVYAFYPILPVNQTANISAPLYVAADPLPAARPAVGGNETKGAAALELENPLNAKDLTTFVVSLATLVRPLVVAIAVLLIIYAGILMITSRGEKEQIEKGKKTLWYALIGLAIVFIGSGFVSIIESILDLRK